MRGIRHPIVGRIAMDQFVIDVDDAVVIWGDRSRGEPSIDEWAAADTISYELRTRMGARIRRDDIPRNDQSKETL